MLGRLCPIGPKWHDAYSPVTSAREPGLDAKQLEDNMAVHSIESETLLTPSEVASLFRVDPKTVTRWAKAGKLSSIRTLGGHRRYRESEVRGLLTGVPQQREGQA